MIAMRTLLCVFEGETSLSLSLGVEVGVGVGWGNGVAVLIHTLKFSTELVFSQVFLALDSGSSNPPRGQRGSFSPKICMF